MRARRVRQVVIRRGYQPLPKVVRAGLGIALSGALLFGGRYLYRRMKGRARPALHGVGRRRRILRAV